MPAADAGPVGNVTLIPGELPRIRLDRPAKRNAVNGPMAERFTELAQKVVDQGAVAAVLEASGPVFTAGADLVDLDDGARAVERMIDCLLTLPVHWVAVVRQPVLGAGMAFLAAVPLVIATPAASFALPELARGFFPASMMTGQAQSLGLRAAYDLAFSARPVGAERAHALGLVNAVIADEHVESHVAGRVALLHQCPRAEVLLGVTSWQAAVRPALQRAHHPPATPAHSTSPTPARLEGP
ncbi:enoyl-CoA hydratase/isomerase family protein [Micromonospora inositola]|uniref:Methylglutaconyl-CoA hydratase n=1 Tax=Micromonospora inositola TaxID=47865 RepID=A0A1C5JN82_9ACTN|nr:enoyl-CoA hydratase/isomerase family protein [Micromonospora inositola]SCG72054.1 methylglutaconyl-CoA hydratase [Micromonospora inositola]